MALFFTGNGLPARLGRRQWRCGAQVDRRLNGVHVMYERDQRSLLASAQDDG
jgi:hypothetical protein